ncbi:UDP-phosphate galactose phosphotransferase, partial [Klebsiella pneumoniae]
MTHFTKNVLCSVFLATADFIGFVLSLYASVSILSITLTHFELRVPDNQVEGWIALHWLLGGCCIA